MNILLKRNLRFNKLSVSGRGRSINIGSPWTPASIAGLQLWLDASQIVGLNDGDAVATWSDLSGNGNHATQATVSKRPTYQTNEQNGLPVVLGDGVDDFLECASTVFPTTDFTIYAVLNNVSGTGANYRAFGSADVGGVNGFCLISFTASAQDYLVLRNGSAGTDIALTGTFSANTPYIYRFTVGGAASEIFVNNTSRGTSSRVLLGTSGVPFQVFSYGPGIQCGNIKFCELIGYTGVHTAGQQALVEAYLNAKWAAY